MCGRTACTKSSGEIADCCTYKPKGSDQVKKPHWKNIGGKTYNPSYNKGPKSCSPILLSNSNFPTAASEDTSERILLPMQWGLVPSWHKGDPKSFSFNMINCRHDTLTTKKSFMNALEKGQRCVVLAEGFYEWQAQGGKKQPYYLQLRNNVTPHVQTEDNASKQLLTFAGLFDKQISDEEGELYTYTIITVDSHPTLKWLHHRMPAILQSPDDVENWLNTTTVPWKKAMNMLVPTDCLEWYPVSNVVNNVRNNTEDCIKKVDISKEAAKKSGSGKLMSSWLKKADTNRTSDVNSTEDVPSSKKKKSI